MVHLLNLLMNTTVNPPHNRVNAPDRRSVAKGPVAHKALSAPCELFLIGPEAVALAAEIQATLPTSSAAGSAASGVSIACFDLAETFLIHIMRYAAPTGVLRFALIHADLKGMSGMETLAQIQKLEPGTRAILLADTTTPATVIDAWHNGAIDFILAPYTAQCVLQAIQRNIESQPQPTTHRYPRSDVDACLKNYQTLTRREREILQLVALGKSSDQIATDVFISVATVKMHRANLMRKLGLANAAQVAAFYHKCSHYIG